MQPTTLRNPCAPTPIFGVNIIREIIHHWIWEMMLKQYKSFIWAIAQNMGKAGEIQDLNKGTGPRWVLNVVNRHGFTHVHRMWIAQTMVYDICFHNIWFLGEAYGIPRFLFLHFIIKYPQYWKVFRQSPWTTQTWFRVNI